VPCRRLEIRVHFTDPDIPEWVTRIDGGGDALASQTLTAAPVDLVGDVAVIFENLFPGLAYGVGWEGPAVA
jgi:hypothetical protein